MLSSHRQHVGRSAAETPDSPAPSCRRQRLSALLALLLPLVLALLLEGGLQLSGFGNSYPLFVPVPDAPDFLRVNRRAVFRFMVDTRETPKLWIRPVYFERRKRPETYRIFVQGGSTAAGYPYGYGASPAGMLQQRLQRTFPQRRIEVVTTAMSAVNSYTLLDFSGEILEQSPDAVVIYAGHNEYVGILGVGSGFSAGRRRPVVLSFLWLNGSRIFQLGQRALAALHPEPRGRDRRRTLMATIVAEQRIPYGSTLYRRGLAQYRANLRALLRRYRRAGVQVWIGTVASNERDQAPLSSGHGEAADKDAWRRRMDAGRRALAARDPRAALDAFDAAVTLDDLHAEGHFERGRAFDALGRHREARAAYLAARDRDELRFRAPGDVNRILRQVAAEQGAHVVEVEQALVRAARDHIVGRDLMLEHLHPNLDGYFVIADAFYEALRAAGAVGSWEHAIPRQVARREMPVTEVDRLYGEYRIAHLTSDWPFTDHRQRFSLPSAHTRVEEIAQSYYRGRRSWPETMRTLLHFHRRRDDFAAAAKVSVLVAEAFPNEVEDQDVAAEMLLRAGRPEADVYRRRAERLAAVSSADD